MTDSSSVNRLVKCSTCDGKMSIGTQRCPHCGETFFRRVGKVLKKEVCDRCGGDGKASWSSEYDGGLFWVRPAYDYCTWCGGRGFVLTYEVVDSRTGKLTDVIRDNCNLEGYGGSKIKPIHRGIKPKPAGCGTYLLIAIACVVIALAIIDHNTNGSLSAVIRQIIQEINK